MGTRNPPLVTVVRRVLQVALLFLFGGMLLKYVVAPSANGGELRGATTVMVLFVLSLLAEAHSRWWVRKHAHLDREDWHAVRNRAAATLLCCVVAMVVGLLAVATRNIPFALLPAFAGAIGGLYIVWFGGKRGSEPSSAP